MACATSVLFAALGGAQEAPEAEPTPTPAVAVGPPDSPTPTPATVATPPSSETPSEPSDAGAVLFMQKCAGCHTVGGGALTGPDLKATQTWPKQNLEPAIVRMEKNVGKLKPEEVQLLADLLLAPDAAARIAEEQKRIAKQQMAKLEPANAAIGEALFFGHTPLANKGLSCAACHAVNGRGGNLAADLTGSFAKLGEVPLGSTIEGVTFPLMQAAYAGKPITKQETMHLVKYLETAPAQESSGMKAPPLHAAGVVGAGLAVTGLMSYYRRRNRGVRAVLVQDAMRRSRS
ncbi:MAG: c-type cytochrome [Candidatus Hydrogenedentes bacterium]|nr:c-type cytochrome [Candidatus Hydrogenedentota bacterium]